MSQPVQQDGLRTLLSLAWPIVVSRSTQVVVGVGDALMVADLGEAALAATTTGAFNTFAVFIFPMGVCFIVSSFSSQLFGQGDLVGARRFGFYGLGIAAISQVLSVAGLLAVPTVLGLLDYSPDVRTQMTEYLIYRLPSGGAAIGIEALANYYGAIGNTRLPMFVNVFAMVLDVALNWILIGGNLGAPALGVKGAALGSTVSTVLAFLVILLVFLRDGRTVGTLLPKLFGSEFLRMLRFGIPSGLNWFFEFFAFNVFVNVVVAGLGTTALAGLMSVMQINSVAFMPAFAVASAGAILVGQNIGAGRKDDVPRIVRLTLVVASAWQGAVGLSYLLVPDLLFSPFARGESNEAQALLEVGARMLMLSALWQLFDATSGTLAEALRAAGDTAFIMWARTVLAWLIFLPCSYISVRQMGAGDVAAVLWMVFYLALLAGVLAWRFRSGAWRRVELVSPV